MDCGDSLDVKPKRIKLENADNSGECSIVPKSEYIEQDEILNGNEDSANNGAIVPKSEIIKQDVMPCMLPLFYPSSSAKILGYSKLFPSLKRLRDCTKGVSAQIFCHVNDARVLESVGTFCMTCNMHLTTVGMLCEHVLNFAHIAKAGRKFAISSMDFDFWANVFKQAQCCEPPRPLREINVIRSVYGPLHPKSISLLPMVTGHLGRPGDLNAQGERLIYYELALGVVYTLMTLAYKNDVDVEKVTTLAPFTYVTCMHCNVEMSDASAVFDHLCENSHITNMYSTGFCITMADYAYWRNQASIIFKPAKKERNVRRGRACCCPLLRRSRYYHHH